MNTEELNAVANTLSIVYRKRGYILIDDVQTILDEHGASLIETTQLLRLLEERGCKISEQGDTEDDLYMYDGSNEYISPVDVKKLLAFYKKEVKAGVPGLPYALEEYIEGLLFYAFLRVQLGLSKIAVIQSIITLQETYDMFLPEGENKSIFDIDSATYIQMIMETICNRKSFKMVRAKHKSAMGTYQMFLTKNKHRIIAECDG